MTNKTPHILIDYEDFRVGGVQRVNTILANHFVSLGWQVTVIGKPIKSCEQDMIPAASKEEMGLIASIPLIETSEDIHDHMRFVSRFVKEQKPDIYFTPLGSKPRLAAIIAGVPHAIHVFHNEYYYNWKEFIAELFLRFRTTYIAVSNFIRTHEAKTLTLPLSSIRTIYNGIDTQRYLPKPNRHDGSILRLISVGRLCKQKGYDRLIEIIKICIIQNIAVQCDIIGCGEEENSLKILAEKANLDENCLRFLGERKNITELLPQYDCFVSTLRWGGFELVLAEAMSCELPVVAFDVGPVKEVIGEEKDNCGILVENGNSLAFVEILKHLANNREEISHRGTLCRQRVIEHFSVEKQTAQYEQLIRELLSCD